MDKMTVRDLRELLACASVLVEELNNQTGNEHADLVRELADARVLIDRVVGSSHMGAALDVVILEEDDETKMGKLVELLRGHGRTAELEYPGFITVAHATDAARTWAIGNANGYWSADLMAADGEVLDGLNLVDESASWSMAQVSTAITAAIAAAEVGAR